VREVRQLIGHAALLAASLLAALPARAEVSAYIEQSAGTSNQDTSQAGRAEHISSVLWLQRYRLDWDQQLWPLLRLNAGGNLDWTKGWTTTGPITTESDAKRWLAYAQLLVGGPILSGALRYDHQEQLNSSTTVGLTATAPTLKRDAWSASASWNPLDLPRFDLRYSHTHLYDDQGVASDLVTDEVFFTTIYRPLQQLDVSYGLRWSVGDDRLRGSEQRELLNTARVSWTDTFLASRLNTYLSYSIANRLSESVVNGVGGTVTTQQFPTAGYSLVEAFPATPERDTLTLNAALIDAELGLSAGLDIGFQRSLSGDNAFRDLGAQFGNALSTVNTVYVYVEKQLPAAVAAGFTWAAYRSDDNVTWTPVPIPAPVVFGLFQNRFEITIDQTEARYLKVVVRPLTTATTTDPQYASIAVTELQFSLVVLASQVKGEESVTSGQLNASARYLILPSVNLAVDSTLSYSHTSNPSRQAWSWLNGISAARQLTRAVGVSGRVDRSDSDGGQGHESLSRASAALSLNPLPTLAGGISASGQVGQTRLGTTWSAGPTAFATADLYTGLSLSGSASYALSENERSQLTSGWTFATSVNAIPNRFATLTLTYGLTASEITGGGLPDRSDSNSRLDTTLTVTPFPALYLAGTYSRAWTQGGPANLATFTGTFSPFPGGDLIMRFGYTETLDTSAQLRQRQWGPGARWNIRRGWYLDVSYSVNSSYSPSIDIDTRAFLANLVISLR
jgi:hypothetical protein